MPSENPFEMLSLETLRQRRSVKWRTHPADVLPLWVAEMDVPLAEPVATDQRSARPPEADAERGQFRLGINTHNPR